jgi:hypothetical protein
MKKGEFRKLLVAALVEDGVEVQKDVVESALNKLAVWMNNAYGCIDWQEAYDESGVASAEYYYEESLTIKQNVANGHDGYMTTNRDTARNRRGIK